MIGLGNFQCVILDEVNGMDGSIFAVYFCMQVQNSHFCSLFLHVSAKIAAKNTAKIAVL